MNDTPDNVSKNNAKVTPENTKKPTKRRGINLNHPLPFATWWPVLVGTAIGLILRLVFFHGKPSAAFAPMLGAFIYFAPLLIGIATVYFAEKIKRRTWAYYIWAPFTATLLCVLGTLLIAVEGWICAIVIFPFFAVIGSLGGLIMGAICRVTHWPRHTFYSFLALPILLGSVEHRLALPNEYAQVERSILIAAKPAEIWHSINYANNVAPEELGNGWVYKIGVPYPLSGLVHDTAQGKVRRFTMGKNIYFDGVAEEWIPNQYVKWRYKFYPDSFPPDALDDHVVIGGHYFDLIDVSYQLTELGAQTRLNIKINYRISTQFNAYAGLVGKLLLANLEETLLDFYKNRSEKPHG